MDPTYTETTEARPTAASAPSLVLGPLLRYAGESEATVWLETDRACEVEVLGRRARTFQVAGHHYAIVVIEELAPDSVQEYDGRAGRRAALAGAGLRLSAERDPHARPRG